MKVHGFPELARTMQLQRRSSEVRGDLDRMALEMTTGRKADMYRATGGNLAQLFAIDRMLERNAVHRHTIDLTETRLELMQSSLGSALALTGGVAVDLVAAVGRGDMLSSKAHSESARRAFVDTVAALNVRIGDQSLFAGNAANRPALNTGGRILADLVELTDGAATADEAVALIDQWFASVAFTQGAYTGSPDPLVAAEVGDGMRVDLAVTAADPALVGVLKGHALAALVAEGRFEGDREQQLALLGVAGARLVAAQEDLHTLRARVGLAQERVEQAKAQGIAERESYELARARIVNADPFEAASNFQALQSQLETVFTVTARLATLRFANFMR